VVSHARNPETTSEKASRSLMWFSTRPTSLRSRQWLQHRLSSRGTADFEQIIESLRTAAIVADLYGEGDCELRSRITGDAEPPKNGPGRCSRQDASGQRRRDRRIRIRVSAPDSAAFLEYLHGQLRQVFAPRVRKVAPRRPYQRVPTTATPALGG
jgi:hypothetical protein